MNDMDCLADVFDGLEPFKGFVPKNNTVDAFGCLTNQDLYEYYDGDRDALGGREIETAFPTIEEGEIWFEAVNWLQAAREASGNYVMMTLGACFGAQAIGAYKALQLVNPMPSKLVLVEPEPGNFERLQQSLRENSIDPDAQWLVNNALTASCSPVIFPVGAPGSGAQNCFSTNAVDMRQLVIESVKEQGTAQQTLENVLLNNKTGLQINLVPGHEHPFVGELQFVSAISLREILGPFDYIDYLEADMQQSEITVFPPFIAQLTKKVHRIHIGTHGGEVHAALHQMFVDHGWEIIFSFAPNSKFETAIGNFETNDGVLTVRNRNLKKPSALAA